MADTFVIKGGRPLKGTVHVPGAKNAALKEIAAALLTKETVTLEGMPQISDVVRMLEIVEALGADVETDWPARTVKITADTVDASRLSSEHVRAIRASVVLLGPLLARCGEINIPYPGGDQIGARPLTAHVDALAQLGATIERTDGHLHAYTPPGGLEPGHVVLPEFSVTATENALMAAAGTPGETTIAIAAAEPHVRDLAALLTAMGAKTWYSGPNTYTVQGVKELHGATHRVIPDLLDAFTFLMAGVVTRGDVTTAGVASDQCELALLKLKEVGVELETQGDRIRALPHSGTYRAARVQALPFPGIPTDLQPLFALLATQSEGSSLIHDPLYENRFRYLEELQRMGADTQMLDPHRAIVSGPTILTGVPITSFDIRAGAVLVLAGLVANGVTTIAGIDHVDRGYEDLSGRLSALGADIQRVRSGVSTTPSQ